ncbi:PEPxxWA-CTERM sorting domain-containing protein [Glacieibacterium frigidum]|uniref:Discoidin domain-containing protein n=1 Tax=Glacieibacterium frigidum TaxID=2593303 RepID=A0A552UHU6_9SPHN|nr:PEPxxWA-CTERM sorting domain-containing protein [Glacieibacterium frigidum]TRW17792.1 discoidin domain-containing protein [Glacieibacterium frigidum]
MFAKTVLGSVIAATVSVAAHAVTVVPVSAVGSSSFPTYNDTFAIDQGPGSATTDWASLGQGSASRLNLDLGAVYTLDTAFVTDRVTSGGGNGGYVGGTTDFTTSFFLQAYTDATFTTTLGSAVIVNQATPGSPSGPSSFLNTVSLSGFTARYIQYGVISSNGANPGLSNIAFNAVPEPATWGLLIAGFAVVGIAARRRRTAVAA